MTKRPIRVLAAIAAIVVVGFAVAALSRPDDPPTRVVSDMSHGNVRFSDDDGFTADLELDAEGLVVTYPGLARRVSG